MFGGGGHVITGNNITNCNVGIQLSDDVATIYNNYLSNKVNLQAEDEFAASTLNATKTKGTSIKVVLTLVVTTGDHLVFEDICGKTGK